MNDEADDKRALNEDDAGGQLTKIEGSIALLRGQISRLPVYQRNPSLCDRVLNQILPKWAASFYSTPVWSKIFKKLPKELNETEPAISFILKLIEQDEDEDGTKFAIIDLCSGFGFASMLLSELLSLTTSGSKVQTIWLLDSQWPLEIDNPLPHHISMHHILNYTWPIPLRLKKIDLKRHRQKKHLPQHVYRDATKVIFMGIHLCKALSVHAINLYADCGRGIALVLKPCCLPGSRNQSLYTGRRDSEGHRVPIKYSFANGFSFRPLDLYVNSSSDSSGEKGNTEEVVQEAEKEDVISVEETNDGHDVDLVGHNLDISRTNNARFSQWVEHLERGCQHDSCRVRRATIQIQKHHFQNQFLFCERISDSLKDVPQEGDGKDETKEEQDSSS